MDLLSYLSYHNFQHQHPHLQNWIYLNLLPLTFYLVIQLKSQSLQIHFLYSKLIQSLHEIPINLIFVNQYYFINLKQDFMLKLPYPNSHHHSFKGQNPLNYSSLWCVVYYQNHLHLNSQLMKTFWEA